MAPNQRAHQAIPWRDANPFFLLSPLMGLLSRAWNRLRGPGPPEPWLVEAATGADQVEAGLEGEAKVSLAIHLAPWDRHPQEKTEDSGAAEEDGKADWKTCPDPKATSSLLEAWGFSDYGDEEYGKKEATSVSRRQRSTLTDGRPAPLSPRLLVGPLQYPLGEEDSEEEEEATEENEVADEKEMTETFFYPPSPGPRPWEYFPGVEEEEDDDEEAAGTSTSLLSLGSMPSTRVCCPQEVKEEEKDEKDQDNEEGRTEKKEATKTSISCSSSESNPRAWEFRSREESQEDEKVNEAAEKGTAKPETHSSVPVQRSLLRAWEYQPSRNTEEEGEDEYSASGATEEEGAAETSSSNPPTSAFLKAWVYCPGEDTEEEEDEGEDEDCASGAAEEEGAAETSSSNPPASVFLKAWVYHPGEDTEEEDEDSNSEAPDEEGAAKASPSNPPTSAFLKAWVYHPGEDTEEENEDKGDDSEAAEGREESDSEPCPSLQAQTTFFRTWIYQPGEDTEEEEAAEEWGETEPRPFQVAIYLPGEKPPPPWAPPRLPLRLQRRLKSSETPTWDPDPESPLKARKVRFSEKVSVHVLAVWAGPARATRRGPWEQLARDRSRFARRIAQAQEELGPCLTPAARARAWARLQSPPTFLPPLSVCTQTRPPTSAPPTAPGQTTPLSPAVVVPSPSPPRASAAPFLGVGGRRG